MPKVSKAYAKSREQEILQAAAACFARAGYRLTSMTDVAAEAGLSVGALYRYFSSKEVLFRSLFVRARQDNQTFWQEARVQGAAPDRLQYVVERHFEAMADPSCRWSLALDVRLRTEALDDDALARHVRESCLAQADALAALLLEAAPRRRAAARSAAFVIIALINDARYQALIDPNVDLRRCKAQVLSLGQYLLAELSA